MTVGVTACLLLALRADSSFFDAVHYICHPACWCAGDESGPLVAESSGFLVRPLKLQHCDSMRIFNRK